MRLLMGILRDRHGTYYARKKVPPHLQEALARVLNNGKSHQVWLKRSLGTKDMGATHGYSPKWHLGPQVRRLFRNGLGAILANMGSPIRLKFFIRYVITSLMPCALRAWRKRLGSQSLDTVMAPCTAGTEQRR
jgi:hypothetical protein